MATAAGTPSTSALETLCLNTIRGLTIDATEKANSGHPGLPLGAAAMGYALWTRHLRHNPKNPAWFNRDRFVLSAGHGSMLLYSLLYLTGYELPLEQIKLFRQLHSMTPGHPENHITPGVEMATGPLGQGISTSVGMAIAERHLANRYNRPGHEIIDHFTFGICSDGDLMEGISAEASSLAGHLKLGKIVFLYDDNHVSLDGPTKMAFTEDVGKRYQAYGWHVQHVDGMDVEAVDQAIIAGKAEKERPSLICCRTIIGYGSPHKAGTSKAHGSPLGPEEAKLTKEALGIPLEPTFYVDSSALDFYRQAVPRGEKLEADWNDRLAGYASAFPGEAGELKRWIAGEPGEEWVAELPKFAEKVATRQASAAAINAVAAKLPNFIGGSADLSESTKTMQEGLGDFEPGSPTGKNIWFGVREHGMLAAVNGMNLHGGVRGYGGTFLVFSDYCRGSIRLSALMGTPSIFVFTHDSIGMGEDGPTHQPVEHVMSLRAMPNMNVMRPCDGNETSACWKVALQTRKNPCSLVLSRQGLPALSPEFVGAHPAERGAYVLAPADGDDACCLVATGSEVQVAVGARLLLQAAGVPTRVVSMPSWFLFEAQEESYRAAVLPRGLATVSVEAGATLGWDRYAQAHVGVDRFGLSAPGELAMRELGITAEHVAEVARELLAR